MTEKGTTASKVINTADMVTSGTKKIKLPILKEFEFPVSNYYDRLWWSDLNEGKHKLDADWIVTTKLLIKTNVSAAEYNANKFKRRFYVDKIIFESVRN